MESRGSSLNPDAPPFIPLSKKGAHVTTRVTTSKDSKGTTTNTNSLTQAFLDFHIDEMERPRTQKGFTVKGQSAMASYNSSTSESVNGFEEKFDMDLTFLKMSFPDIAYQSLVDAYDFNQRDLEETLDMLIELQADPFESPESLPDNLDISYVPEFASSAQFASAKLKNVAGDAAEAPFDPSDPRLHSQ